MCVSPLTSVSVPTEKNVYHAGLRLTKCYVERLRYKKVEGIWFLFAFKEFKYKHIERSGNKNDSKNIYYYVVFKQTSIKLRNCSDDQVRS